MTTIRCPYHGWIYSLDGSLRGAAGMGLNTGFRRGDYCLPQVRCEDWLGWIMVSLNPDAPSAAEQYGEVQNMINDFGMEDYTQLFHETHVWNTNWKVLAENFMESYHLPVCHAGTIGGRFSKLEEMDCPPGLPAFNYHYILKDASFRLAVAHPKNTRLQGRLAAHDDPAGDLSQPADHPDARVFLVSEHCTRMASIIAISPMAADYLPTSWTIRRPRACSPSPRSCWTECRSRTSSAPSASIAASAPTWRDPDI